MEELKEDLEVWILQVDVVLAFYMLADDLVRSRDGLELLAIIVTVLVGVVLQCQLSIRRLDGLQVIAGADRYARSC